MVLLRTLCTVVHSGVQCGYHGWCSVASVTPGPELADITQCGERGGQAHTGQGRGVWGADHISHLTPVTHTPGPSDISDLADTRRTPGGGYKDPLLVLWSVTTEWHFVVALSCNNQSVGCGTKNALQVVCRQSIFPNWPAIQNIILHLFAIPGNTPTLFKASASLPLLHI